MHARQHIRTAAVGQFAEVRRPPGGLPATRRNSGFTSADRVLNIRESVNAATPAALLVQACEKFGRGVDRKIGAQVQYVPIAGDQSREAAGGKSHQVVIT